MRLGRLAVLVLIAGLAAPASAAAGELTGRVLVSVRPGAGSRARAAAVHALLARTGARLAGAQVPQIGLVTVAPPPGRAPGAWARELARLPNIEAAQPERYVQPRALAPNDPALTTQENGTPPGTPVQWTLAREGFFDAYPVTRGDGAVVAVIDSGIDASHPELAGKIKDAVDQDTSRTDGPATVDENGHGTPVAGLACAATDNGVGLAGAGWGCQLLIEKYDATESSIAASIVDATQRGAEAINMSFGDDGSSPAPKPVVDAIGFAFAHDVVLVAAAANADTEEQGSPSNVLQPTGTGPNIDQGEGLDVTAADFSDQRATFGRDAAGNPVRAGRGTQISLAAYGTYGLQGGPRGLFVPFPGQTTQLESGSLVPPEPPCQCRTSFGGDSRYAYLQGTSFAAPQVAALGAMLRHLNPDVPVTGILRAIKETARRPTGTGWSPDLGWGIVNAGAAVQAVRVIDVTPPESHLRAPRRVRSRSFTLRWTGDDPAAPGLVPSGIADFRVYTRRHGRRAHKIATTTRTSLRFRGQPGGTYSFWTVAVDKAGIAEPAPAKPDATTRIARRARP